MPRAPSNKAPGAAQLTSAITFIDRSLEDAYRQSRLSTGRAWATAVVLILAMPTVAFAASDFELFGWSSRTWYLLGLRAAFLLGCAATLVVVRRTEDARFFDRVLIAWWGSLNGLVVAVNLTRPAAYAGNNFIDVLIVLTAYIGLPTRWRLQVVAGIGASLSLLAVFLLYREAVDPVTRNVTLIGFAYANGIGLAYARQYQLADRRRFLAYEHERELEEMLDIVTELVPMCASCKKVHLDDGWEPIETIVSRGTGAEVTHGLCPDCVGAYFPGQESELGP